MTTSNSWLNKAISEAMNGRLIKANPSKSKYIINAKSSDAILEITKQCFTGCVDCYLIQGAGVGPRHPHTALQTCLNRLDKITQLSFATKITILGGEPLLHPDLDKIFKHVLKRGLRLRITTSGWVPKKGIGHNNLMMVLELYKAGLIEVELSLHPGRNDQDHKKMHDFYSLCHMFESKYQARKTNIKMLRPLSCVKTIQPMSTGDINTIISTIITLDNQFGDPHQMFKLIRTITSSLPQSKNSGKFFYHDKPTSLKKISTKLARGLSKAYKRPSHLSAPFSNSLTVTLDHDGKFYFRIWHAVSVKPSTNQTIIDRPLGRKNMPSVCPMMLTKAKEDMLHIPSLLIRTDGEVVFPQPACITMNTGLFNIDQPSSEILEKANKKIRFIKKLNIDARAEHGKRYKTRLCALDRNNPSGENRSCYTCLHHVCNICHATPSTDKGNQNEKQTL